MEKMPDVSPPLKNRHSANGASGKPGQPRSALQPGWYIYWNSRTFQVMAGESPNPLLVPVKDAVTLEPDLLSYPDMLLSAANEAAAPIFAPTVEALHAERERRSRIQDPHNTPAAGTRISNTRFKKLLARAASIISTVEAVDRLVAECERLARLSNSPSRHTNEVRQACSLISAPIALPTYYKYRKLCIAQGWDAERIAASLHRSSFNGSSIDRAALHFVDTLVLRYYSRNRPMTVSRLYNHFAKGFLERTGGLWIDPGLCANGVPEDLVSELLKFNLPVEAILSNPEKRRLLKPIRLPSRGWFYGYARWFVRQADEGRAVITQRYGKGKWEAEHMVFDTFVTRATLPLQYVFADHCLLDIFIVDKATRTRIDRLWWTVYIDAYSRSVVGMILLYESPCVESLQGGLDHTIFPKTSHTDLGVEGEWACFGIPLNLMLDNAWAHHSHSLESLAAQISRGGRYDSMALDFRVPYLARRGALIERFFGNISRQIKESLRGAILSSSPKDVRAAREQACLLYDDLYRFLHQVVLKYQHTPHTGLGGMTPHEKWMEGIRSRIPAVPPRTPEVKRLFLRLHPETRQIRQKGISMFGMHYWSPELAVAATVGRDGSPIEYEVRYDPHDISRLSLFLEGRWVGDVYAKQRRLPDGSHNPISLLEREVAMRLAIAAGGRASDWLSYEGAVDEVTKQRVAERKQAHAKAKGEGVERQPRQLKKAGAHVDASDAHSGVEAHALRSSLSPESAALNEIEQMRTLRLVKFAGDRSDKKGA